MDNTEGCPGANTMALDVVPSPPCVSEEEFRALRNGNRPVWASTPPPNMYCGKLLRMLVLDRSLPMLLSSDRSRESPSSHCFELRPSTSFNARRRADACLCCTGS